MNNTPSVFYTKCNFVYRIYHPPTILFLFSGLGVVVVVVVVVGHKEHKTFEISLFTTKV
jgi:hypothetical protein